MSGMLDIQALHIDLGGGRNRKPILRGVDLEVPVGTVHGLVGESGAGKSMVGRAVLGLLPPAARIPRGSIVFDGIDITNLPERARRHLLGRGMALIPQDPMTSLNPAIRVGDQIIDLLHVHLGLDRGPAQARMLELLAEVHIRNPERVARLYAHELSGGMRQRILIASAFALRPKLIVADEPTTALDVTVQRQVLRLIKELQRSVGTTILFITHDLGVVAKICDTVSVLHSGRVVEDGLVRTLFAWPRHPYTQALFAATPRYDRPGERLKPVPAELTAHLQAEAVAYDRSVAWDRGHA
ncbi:MAG TPA: ABC transporter ATP-binding protein [Alphaproteobacteria bacterium]|jgi:peptide/nickel transport system ATP-binding protein